MNDDKEIIEGDSPSDISKSILNSVKKLLGLLPELKEFDSDILMNLNSAIFTLQQIGVGPNELFIVEDETQTYDDFLGEMSNLTPQVRMYLYYKCKIGFDPPQNSSVFKSIEDMIKEAEWRLNTEVETFEQLRCDKDEGSDNADPIKPGEGSDDVDSIKLDESPLIKENPP